MSRLLVAVLLLNLLGHAAGADEPDPSGVEFFESKVRPILVARCYKCHSNDAENLRGSLHLDSRDGWMAGGDSGPTIVPSDPDASLLIKTVRYDGDIQMPPEGKLAESEIAALTEWVKRGAPDPRTGQPVAKTRKPIDIAEGRKHWAFQPLTIVPPPEVNDAGWSRTPVDRFVWAPLAKQQLAPNPIVDRRTLIRRGYFDLLGLPPAPEEVEAFVNDPAADAYEQLIDRLLVSPHYGERWARHWLDLARFAESHGFEHDYDRPTAYHYRDFVIKALNQDLPYDRFVKWQIAGDEYEPENPLALMATGYLAAGVHSTQITKNQVEKERYDELDDILGTMGTSLLGLTIGCARCHDHKYDPIPTQDYYQLLSTFTTAVRSEVDLNLDRQQFEQAKIAYDREHAPLVAAIEHYIAEQLPARLDTYLEKQRAAAEAPQDAAELQPAWQVLRLDGVKSAGGATLAPLDDGSLLAAGTNADNDTYTFTAHTAQTGITCIRLEALAHESLPKHGPGRAGNGNFALSNVEVSLAPVGQAKDAAPIKIAAVRATFEQPGLPAAAAIDDDKKSAWAVDGQIGKNQAIVLEFPAAIGFPGGTALSFTLSFANNKSHSIGRMRLALSTAPLPVPLDSPAVPQNAAEIGVLAARSSASASAEDRKAMLDWFRPLDAGWLALDHAIRDHAAKEPQPQFTKVLITSEGLPAVRLHTQGGDFLEATHFLERGDPNRKKEVATQSFLEVLMPAADAEKSWQVSPPAGWRTSYRRRALAEWMTDTRAGAGQLLARVIVNRLWQHHMGRGIVSTPSDFGTQGQRPTHPELLDYLATELIRDGWRLKSLHRLIMTSAVYMQGSQADEARAEADPDNKLLWHRPWQRLEGEVIRDAILAAGGTLDLTMFGPGTLDENQRRRSIYFTVKRSKLVPMMLLFDAPDALQGVGQRATTTIAPQALVMLNSATVRDAARHVAGRAAAAGSSSAEQVDRAYRIAFARPPAADELADAVAFLDEQRRLYAADGQGEDAQLRALVDFCQVLFGLNEFVYVE